MRRAGARPRRQRGFISAPTKFHRTKTFPLGGRWQPEGLTDEGRQRKDFHRSEKPTGFSLGRSRSPLRHGKELPPRLSSPIFLPAVGRLFYCLFKP